MKLKKSLFTLANRLKKMSEREVQDEISKLINSYELKMRYGASNKLEAFTKSVYTPTTKPNILKEAILSEQKKKLKSEKYSIALLLKNEIIDLRKQAMSFDNIAQYLSTYKVENSKRTKNKKPYFNKTYIIRFCKKHAIK